MRIRQFSEQTRFLIEIGGGAFIAVWIALFFLLGIFEPLELLTYDWRFKIRGEREPLNDILIISIDEESEKNLQQRAPWKRSLHAKLVQTLMQHNPKLIVYDVIFKTPTEEAEDEAFANALYDAYDEERDLSLVILAQYISGEKLEQPLPLFADNAGGVGLINLYKDKDDIVRSTPVSQMTIVGEAKQYNLWLGLEAAALYKGGVNKIEFPRADTTVLSRVEENSTEELLRVIAPGGKLYINYIGGTHSYPIISFWKIIQGKFDPKEIEGKVIFIGDTMLTSHDYFWTPFRAPSQKYLEQLRAKLPKDANLPKSLTTFGVEIHAQAFQTILENSYIRKVPTLWSAVFILCIGSFSGILLFKDRTFLINSTLLIASGVLVWGVSQYLFNTWNLWVDFAPLEIAIVVNYIIGLAFQRSVAHYNRNKVKGAFQQYVSTAVVEEMLKHPEKLQLGGERKSLTILFSDIRGFTSISERMESQELVVFLNEYLTAMTEIVLQYHGTLDKYMGDALMAIYGAPIDQEDHATRACSTALDMINRLRQLRPKWQEQGRPFMDIGIGINSGLMTVGNMGSEKRFDFTVMGDNVNLGSRLEGINKQYGTNIIISEYTYQNVNEKFIVRELDLVKVKGKEAPVRIYELVGQTGQIDINTLQRIKHFEQGLAAYRNMQWDEAIERFNHVLSLDSEDVPAQIYIQRCQTYQEDPPPENWDGVYTMKTK
jgi:adenylate cyclase